MKKKYVYLASFLTPIVIMEMVYYLFNLYPFSDKTITSGDFVSQYLPLYVALKESILSLDFSSLYWSFSKGLGGAMPSVLGFNSISPLTLLYAFIPLKHYSILTLIVTLLRYGFCGLTFSYYLMKKSANHQKDYTPVLIICFSIIYALSGFIVSQQYNPNFLDNLIYLPLLAIGVEKILDGKNSIKFSLLLALMLFTQFYTGYMTCLFIVLYGLGYVIGLDITKKEKIIRYLSLGLFSILGVMICSAWLLPLFNNLLESKASAKSIFEIDFSILYQPLLIFSKFFIGSFHWEEWGASEARPQIYIGMLGLIGLCHYFISSNISKKEKLGSIIMLIILFLSFNIKFFDQIWHMGQRPVGFYFRNSWVFIFIALILGFKSLNFDLKIEKKDIPVYLILISLLIGSVIKIDLIYLENYQIWLTFIIFFIIILTLSFSKKLKIMLLILILTTSFELFGNAFIGLKRIPWFASNQNFEIAKLFDENKTFDELKAKDKAPFYRIEFYKNPIDANQNYYSKVNGLTHFTSSLEFSTIDIFSKLGLPSSTSMINYMPTPFTDAIFNLKYFVDDINFHPQTQSLLNQYEYYSKYNDTKNVYYNPYTLNLGFIVDSSFNDYQFNSDNPIETQNDLLKLLFNTEDDLFEKINFSFINQENLENNAGYYKQINSNLPIKLQLIYQNADSNYLYFMRMPTSGKYEFGQSDLTMNGQQYGYQDRFTKDQIWSLSPDKDNNILFEATSDKINFYNIPTLELYRFNIESFKQMMSEKQKENLTFKTVSNHKIIATANLNGDNNQSVFLSIPFNSGWKVKVDNKETHIYKVWDAFIGFDLPKGHHQILLTYQPPGLMLGFGIMILAITCLWIIYYIEQKNKMNLSEYLIKKI